MTTREQNNKSKRKITKWQTPWTLLTSMSLCGLSSYLLLVLSWLLFSLQVELCFVMVLELSSERNVSHVVFMSQTRLTPASYIYSTLTLSSNQPLLFDVTVKLILLNQKWSTDWTGKKKALLKQMCSLQLGSAMLGREQALANKQTKGQIPQSNLLTL